MAPTLKVRTVIIHYHIFKNAGTSLDDALKSRLGTQWTAYEHPRPITPSEMAVFVVSHPEVVAVSSHNALLPPPELGGVRVVPVVFVRHPLDRARSIYDFERGQRSHAPGPVRARQLGLGEYLEWRLALGDGTDPTIRDFQTRRLALGGEGASDLERAVAALATLPFVGLVEGYRESVHRLEATVQVSMPGLRIPVLKRNRTSGRGWSLAGRLRRLRSTIGPDLYQRLSDANAGDLALWTQVSQMYGRKGGPRGI